MRFASVYAIATLASALVAPALGLNELVNRDLSIDVCGEVEAQLKIPNLLHKGTFITIGLIKECLCISSLPQYVTSNVLALGAIALVGKATVLAELTKMVNECQGREQCQYPTHSVPSCKRGTPCFYTCKDGYTAYPAGKPTQCVCAAPYKECNGKCGTFKSCASSIPKREIRGNHCRKGLTACNVPGRGTSAWECVDTQTDLESCGGCPHSTYLGVSGQAGKDCSAIRGVADVACQFGECVVHKCMPGYDIDRHHSECLYSEDKDPEILAAQFGLEHNQL